MDIRPPMYLFLGGELFGWILTYDYETPWASGKFESVDKKHLYKLIEVCELLDDIESWSDCSSVEEDDKRWQLALGDRGITQMDADEYSKGSWIIQTQDNIKNKISSLPVFDKNGFITWRW